MTNIPILAQQIVDRLIIDGTGIVTAESCTAGLIIGALTEISGASSVIDRSFITYSNQSKHEILGVTSASLETQGAVSEIVAEEMAAGALLACPSATYSIAVTGIAGPGGGTDTKPVGLVYIGIGKRNALTQVSKHNFAGNRQAVRQQTVEAALSLFYEHLTG